MIRISTIGLLAVALVAWQGSTPAAGNEDWPQFRGPNRDGVSPSKGLLTSWPEGGPRRLWVGEGAGRGYSSCAVVGDRLYTMGDSPSSVPDDNREFLSCFDASNGKLIWNQPLGEPWTEGPDTWQSSRSTPTVDGDRVYALTPHGKLCCCQASDGKILWSAHLVDDFSGGKGDSWGYGESVLIDGDLLVCTPGKSENTMVALNKHTGLLVWSSQRPEDRGAGHASIQISSVGGQKVYVNTTASGAMGVRASDGKLLWTYDIDRTTAVIPSPIIRDDLVFFTAGYGRGGALLKQVPKADGVEVEEIYPPNPDLQNKHGGVVLVDGYLYGDTDSRGMPFCAELMTGELQWKKRGSGRGSVAVSAADGHLYLLFSNARVALVRVDPGAYKEVSAFDLDSGIERPSWAHPSIAHGKLFIRHDDKIFCFDLRH